MKRTRLRRRPELESLETVVLLSGISGAAANVAREPLAGGPIVLSGIASGTYKTTKIGEPTTFSEKGVISPLGKATIKGSIDYLEVNPTGTVTLTGVGKKHGKVFASVSTAGPYSPVYYTITGATGEYAGDTGSGVALVSSAPAKGKGPAHGKVTITFLPD